MTNNDPRIDTQSVLSIIEETLMEMIIEEPEYPYWAEDEELDAWRERRLEQEYQKVIKSLIEQHPLKA